MSNEVRINSSLLDLGVVSGNARIGSLETIVDILLFLLSRLQDLRCQASQLK